MLTTGKSFCRLTQALDQEYHAGRLEFNPSINRLKRAEASCQFCSNELWQFPDGCPYGKDKELPPDEGELEKIVQQVVHPTLIR